MIVAADCFSFSANFSSSNALNNNEINKIDNRIIYNQHNTCF